MRKKVTITLDEAIYQGLRRRAGRGQISRFIEALLRQHVIDPELETAYKAMAKDEEREAEALEWAESTIGDVSDEAR